MQFVVIARDGDDSEALGRRLAAREKHLARAGEAAQAGQLVAGGAMLDEDGTTMIGSVAIYDFPDRGSLDAYLRDDPYVSGDVWRDIEVRPIRLAFPER